MKIELDNVSKRYGASVALDGLSLSIESNALMLIGPSGGGKSTTLRLLAGLEKPDTGHIAIDGARLPDSERELRAYRRSIGVVFQSYNLFPHLDAVTNIALPLEKSHGLAPQAARKRAMELLARFRLESEFDQRPSQLSGGQNQRVAIARAIAHDPAIVLFDEPTSALDPEMSAEVLDVIEELIRDGKRCVVATHQMGFARRAGQHAAFISEGKVVDLGSCGEFFESPRAPETAAFLSRELRY